MSRLLNFIRLSSIQGGFRAGQSSLHTAFVFQEIVTYLRECGHKAYVAFLDARKAFDTVWHEGLFVKLHIGLGSLTLFGSSWCLGIVSAPAQ